MQYTVFDTPILRPLLALVARVGLRLSGWRVEGQFPADSRYVLIGAPHTSNWDFVLMLGIAWDLGLKFKYLGKHTLFKPPFGFVTRSDPVRMTLGDLGAIAGIQADLAQHALARQAHQRHHGM